MSHPMDGGQIGMPHLQNPVAPSMIIIFGVILNLTCGMGTVTIDLFNFCTGVWETLSFRSFNIVGFPHAMRSNERSRSMG